ncbi:cytochrome c oxidase assembly protein COX16 homolog, mitochondrial-like [Apostichopus japonicus]|uniref:cytochrome c oxidase assembly protein COX16 homolog, mitochondrial-like n=1 Tax=Stichopus japonicus TaxID=307972 RepID=UPI003AB89BB3
MDPSIRKIWNSAKRSSFLKYGFPMLILIVGGSFGLKEFRTLRYDIIDKRRKVDPETEAEHNPRRKTEKVSIESEYQKLQGQNLDDWRNIRGPRPWENSKEFQEILRQHKEEDQRRAEKVWKKPAS